jgi:hypothetical protein
LSYVQGLPVEITRAREPVLAKVLSHLPDEILSALAHGLERHAGRLEAGRLYSDYDGGGCAVGVMLRELSPAEYEQGRLQFWARRRRHRSVLTERVPFEPSLVTRLSHVEMCFDRTAFTLCEHVGGEDVRAAANTTGRWIAEECRQQLRTRSRAGHGGFFVPEEWLSARREHRTAPGRAPVASLPALTRMRRVAAHDGREVVVTLARKRALPRPMPAPIATSMRRVTAADGREVVVKLPGKGAVQQPTPALPRPTPAPALALAA